MMRMEILHSSHFSYPYPDWSYRLQMVGGIDLGLSERWEPWELQDLKNEVKGLEEVGRIEMETRDLEKVA